MSEAEQVAEREGFERRPISYYFSYLIFKL